MAAAVDFGILEEEIARYVEKKYEVFLIAGIHGAGKTALLEAFKADRTLREQIKRNGLVIPTSPENLECHPFPSGKRKLLFVDASGEHFRNLYADPSEEGAEVTASQVRFLRVLSKGLSGLILLLNLEDHFSLPEDTQTKVLRNTLIILRFLVGGGQYVSGRTSFQDQVDDQVPKLARLRVPVQLLFSRADRLKNVRLPESPMYKVLYPSARGPNRSSEDQKQARLLFPAGDNPLFVCHIYLPKLFEALTRHVHCFRFDFVHSLAVDPDTKVIESEEGLGADSARQWLIKTSGRPWWTMIATRHMLRAQSFLDRKILRRDRWYELPVADPPKRKP